MTDQALQHYGVLGMKWGVRRDRGPDGLVKGSGKASDDYLRVKELRRQKTKKLTNAELRQVIERMNLEQQYKNLSKQQVNAGGKAVKGILKKIGDTAVNTAISVAIGETIREGIRAKRA